MHISTHGIKSNIAHAYNVVANQIGHFAHRTVSVVKSTVSAVVAHPQVRNSTFVISTVGLTALSIIAGEKLANYLEKKRGYTANKAANCGLVVETLSPAVTMVALQAAFNKSLAYKINPKGYLIDTAINAYAISSFAIFVTALFLKKAESSNKPVVVVQTTPVTSDEEV